MLRNPTYIKLEETETLTEIYLFLKATPRQVKLSTDSQPACFILCNTLLNLATNNCIVSILHKDS